MSGEEWAIFEQVFDLLGVVAWIWVGVTQFEPAGGE